MMLLLTQSGNDGQQTLSKVTACATLGPKAALAPQHDRAQSPLRGIIGKLYTLLVNESPQGRLVLEQGATQSGTLEVVTQRPFMQDGAPVLEFCDKLAS
jgi:hypothetical protein